ncbi:MAG: helix-turn-helix domain-containing protein [Sandaracinus sp.]|nr:helix-turn-helix domain-containing protein [Sandaracinus sp.]MCB9611557.1 helix-turn-helix domain-containing protein [Sandaracinus sp.]MCB9618771.1 helix-turn-helix domain-containing protein [Sandaracinus sp.]
MPSHLSSAERALEPAVGDYLRRERELRAVSLEEIAQTTRIPLKVLRDLENDRHEQLPGDVFVRGFLRSYSRALGLDDTQVVARYDSGRAPAPAPTAITALVANEKGRRFGLAIAVVVLLILFTLALSIVLRPRHRDVPVELSQSASDVRVLSA